jgi:hypothetical protein
MGYCHTSKSRSSASTPEPPELHSRPPTNSRKNTRTRSWLTPWSAKSSLTHYKSYHPKGIFTISNVVEALTEEAEAPIEVEEAQQETQFRRMLNATTARNQATTRKNVIHDSGQMHL